MSSGAISRAIQRQLDRPDIHKAFARPKGSVGYGEDVFDMVRDLKEHVPELSHRQLSTLVGIATFQIRKALDNSVPDERWTTDDNEASTNAELSALQDAHGSRSYEDHPGAATEYDTLDGQSRVGRVLFTAPQPRDVHRRADQSHAIRGTITLPKFPFLPLPNRYADLEECAA